MTIAAVYATILDEAAPELRNGTRNSPLEDNRQRTVLVAIHDDSGTVGYGEANANAEAVAALIGSGTGTIGGWDDTIAGILVGAEPSDPRQLWKKLKSHTFWSCASGIGHVALAGTDMALWDLAGKLKGVPTWQLLGDRQNPDLRAYATLYHGAGRFVETLSRTLATLDAAIDAGMTAAKLEAMSNNTRNADELVALVERVREHVGDDYTLLLDVGYRWETIADALECTQALDKAGLFLLETPFLPEKLDAYRRLRGAMTTPISGCDILTAAADYQPLLDNDAVDILQAGACRTGISDMDELARRAADKGRQFVPWGWCATALTTAANLHLSVVHANVPLIEYAPPFLYPESALRNQIAGPEPTLASGAFALPERPGLGVDVDTEALERYGLPQISA